MDDTVWHCESKDDLQNILDDISELYQLNNIQVNPSKSDLIHISSNKTSFNTTQDTTPLNFNNQPITPRKPNETIRYLGIFLDGKGSTKPTLEKIFSKVSQFIHIIQYKKLLPIQNKLILQVSSSNIERCFNTNELLNQISIHRIKEWLFKIWKPLLTRDTILQNYRKTINFTIIFQLYHLYKNNILLNNSYLNQLTTYKQTNQLNNIYNFIPPPNYLTTLSLKNNKILFLEQLLTADNHNILPWKNIYLRTLKS